MLDMSCSFTADAEGYVYDLGRGRPIPPRDALTVEQGPGPWVAGHVGPTPPAADGSRESTHRMWFRVPGELPDDEHLHTLVAERTHDGADAHIDVLAKKYLDVDEYPMRQPGEQRVVISVEPDYVKVFGG